MRRARAAARVGPSSGAAGFTLVELVVVIVIAGVLASIAMPRFFSRTTFAERGYYEELASALRLAQKVALASGCAVRFRSSASGYEARQQLSVAGRCDPTDGSWGTPVVLADGSLLAGAVPSDVSVSPDLELVFDATGATDLTADGSLTVGAFTLGVDAASGYVAAP